MKRTKKFIGIFLSLCTLISCMTGLTFQANAEDDPRIIVALGDSYSSGEGIQPFYGQENDLEQKIQDPDWLVHRSSNAWSGMLTLDGVPMTRNENWFFVAASEARVKDLAGAQIITYNKDSFSGTAEIAPQLDIFDSLSMTANDYVTVTIGGNDIGFVDIMTCAVIEALKSSQPLLAGALISEEPYKTLAEKTVTEMVEDIKAHFDEDNGIRNRIKSAYKSIAEKAGDATIIVAGYPRLFTEDGFDMELLILKITFTEELCNAVNEGVKWFNNELGSIVSECAEEGMNIRFVDVQQAFFGKEAYAEDAYITGFIFGAKEQDINESKIVSLSSMHPNLSGAEAYAAAVQAEINRSDLDLYKKEQKQAADDMLIRSDTEKCAQLIENAKNDIDAHKYDEAKTLTENKAAVDEIINNLKATLEKERNGGNKQPGNYAPAPAYVPSGSTTTTTTTTTTAIDTTPDISKLNISASETAGYGLDIVWDTVPDASGYTLSVKIGGKYVVLQKLSSAFVDVVLGNNGKYYVSEGDDYNVYKYNYKTGKLDKTGTLKASKIDSVVKANNVTLEFMIQYTRNGKLSAEKDSYKISKKIYYKPAVTLSTGKNPTTGKSFIRLDWDKVEGATAYRVYKYVNGKLRAVTELDADRHSLKISGTKTGKEYTYAVKALVYGKWTKVYNSDLANIISE